MRWTLTVAAVALLGCGLAVVLKGGDSSVFVWSVVGAITFILIANIDRIASFKAGPDGIELKRLIEEAEVTIDQLRTMAIELGRISLANVARAGFLGPFTDDEGERLRDGVVRCLKAAGVPEASVSQLVRDEWRAVVESEYAQSILGFILPAKGGPATREAWDQLRRGHIAGRPSPEAIERFLNEHDLMDEGRRELIADYRMYVDSGHHRRPEMWRKRKSWPPLGRPMHATQLEEE